MYRKIKFKGAGGWFGLCGLRRGVWDWSCLGSWERGMFVDGGLSTWYRWLGRKLVNLIHTKAWNSLWLIMQVLIVKICSMMIFYNRKQAYKQVSWSRHFFGLLWSGTQSKEEAKSSSTVAGLLYVVNRAQRKQAIL